MILALKDFFWFTLIVSKEFTFCHSDGIYLVTGPYISFIALQLLANKHGEATNYLITSVIGNVRLRCSCRFVTVEDQPWKQAFSKDEILCLLHSLFSAHSGLLFIFLGWYIFR